MSHPYNMPDYMPEDVCADNRDARDLSLEDQRADAWDELLSEDGDISEVLELLTEHPLEVLNLLRAHHRQASLQVPAYELAARLHELAHSVVEGSLS